MVTETAQKQVYGSIDLVAGVGFVRTHGFRCGPIVSVCVDFGSFPFTDHPCPRRYAVAVLDPHVSKLTASASASATVASITAGRIGAATKQDAHTAAVPVLRDDSDEGEQLEREQAVWASMRCLRKKMSLLYTASYRYRRALQTMAAGLFLIYITLVLYQSVCGGGAYSTGCTDGTDGPATDTPPATNGGHVQQQVSRAGAASFFGFLDSLIIEF